MCLFHSFHPRLFSLPPPGIYILKSHFASQFAMYSVRGAEFREIVCPLHSSYQRLKVTVEILKSQFATEIATKRDCTAEF